MANGYRADKVNVAHPGAPRRVASASRWDSPSGFVSHIVAFREKFCNFLYRTKINSSRKFHGFKCE